MFLSKKRAKKNLIAKSKKHRSVMANKKLKLRELHPADHYFRSCRHNNRRTSSIKGLSGLLNK